MDPHRSFSNSIVKGYSGEDTKGGALWENNTMSKFFIKKANNKEVACIFIMYNIGCIVLFNNFKNLIFVKVIKIIEVTRKMTIFIYK